MYNVILFYAHYTILIIYNILYNIIISNCYHILLIIIRGLYKIPYKYKLEMLHLILINKIYNKLYHRKCKVIFDAAQ